MLILLAISCNIRQQNLALTSSLYRCNSTGASIPLLDYREGVTAYANFTFNSTLPKQTRHPFSKLVYLCVCLCVSEGELCKWPVCILSSVQGYRGNLQETSPLKCLTDWPQTSLCVRRVNPGQRKINGCHFIFRSHLYYFYLLTFILTDERWRQRILDCCHCHWCLQKLLLCYFSDCLVFVILLASPPLSTLGAVKIVSLQQPIYGCLYFFN